jgi:mRNA interferase RelE/StbE
MIRRWTLVFLDSFNKKMESLAKTDRQRIRAAANKLADGPRAEGLDIKPLKGRPEWRLRVGQWRILFLVDNEEIMITVISVAPRGDAYK